MATTHTIGELARDFRVTTRTCRFYEEHGLLNPSRIGVRGTQRVYSDTDRLNLMSILEAKRLGYSIERIKQLADGSGRIVIPAEAIAQQIARLGAQREEIARAMLNLRTLEAEHAVAA